MSIRNYFRTFKGLSRLTGSISVALKSREQGILSPPCVKSYFLRSVVVHIMVPPRRKDSEHPPDTFRGKCPMIAPSFFIATAHRSDTRYVFGLSFAHQRHSNPAPPPILIYIRGSLECFWKTLPWQLLSPLYVVKDVEFYFSRRKFYITKISQFTVFLVLF